MAFCGPLHLSVCGIRFADLPKLADGMLHVPVLGILVPCDETWDR